MIDTRMLRQFDPLMFFSTLALVGLGALMIYSATFQTDNATLYVRQIQWAVAGVLFYFIVLQIDYHSLIDFSAFFYFFSLALLVAVLIVGKKISGARSWFGLGYFNFQPSEIAKLASILFLAKFLSHETRNTISYRDVFVAGLIMAVPMLLIILQPDMGTTITFLPPLLLMLFLAGIKYRLILVAMVTGLASLPVLWMALKPYQKMRILTYLDPTTDPLGSGYQILQSKIAVGSGRIAGKGLFAKTTQAYLDYIPEKHTDFIFSILAEDFGLIGVSVALGLYLLLMLRMISTAKQARDRVGVYITMGIFSLFFFHFFINIGMIIGLMPITGLPLPLMSYGGSSLLSTMVGLGIIMNIRMRRFVN
jgi:rod shape determining protein RodA